MLRTIAAILFVLLLSGTMTVSAQEETCSKLGAWLWHFELTGMANHADLADSLVSLGIERIYIKVADGKVNSDSWPEIINTPLVDMYKTRGMEVWAWSYNYPNNFSLQGEALYVAGKTGYDGFVVDVEMEFDGDGQSLDYLFNAFDNARNKLIAEGYAEEFPLYCTTWGNPKDHNFDIAVIDNYVDGFLAQTYVEHWGPSYVANLESWIQVGNDEYAELGATKPVHHILAIEKNLVAVERVNAFFETAGPESSIWRIPGGGIPDETWETWSEVDWGMNFCATTLTSETYDINVRLWPNPAAYQVHIGWDENISEATVVLYDVQGRVCQRQSIMQGETMDVSRCVSGYYIVELTMEGHRVRKSLVIAH